MHVARTEQCTLPLGAGAVAIWHSAVKAGGMEQVKRSRAQLSPAAEQLTGTCSAVRHGRGSGFKQYACHVNAALQWPSHAAATLHFGGHPHGRRPPPRLQLPARTCSSWRPPGLMAAACPATRQQDRASRVSSVQVGIATALREDSEGWGCLAAVSKRRWVGDRWQMDAGKLPNLEFMRVRSCSAAASFCSDAARCIVYTIGRRRHAVTDMAQERGFRPTVQVLLAPELIAAAQASPVRFKQPASVCKHPHVLPALLLQGPPPPRPGCRHLPRH